MIVARLFNLLQGLVALAVGLYCAGLGDLTVIGIDVRGAGAIETHAAIGGTWIFLGLLMLTGVNSHRARDTAAMISILYLVVATVRILAMQSHAAESFTLIYLAFEMFSSLLGLMIWRTLNPNRRRIFGS